MTLPFPAVFRQLRVSLRAGPLRSAAAVLVAVAGATSLNIWLDGRVSLTVLAMVYLVAVVAVAYRGSRQASALTACLAVLALNFFFVPPRGQLTVEGSEQLLTLGALLGVALLVSSLAARLRAVASQAELREQRAQALQRLTSRLAGLPDEQAMARAGRAELRAAFGDGVTLALRLADGRLDSADAGHPLSEAGVEVRDALWHCATQREAVGHGTPRWSGIGFVAMPLEAGGECVGALAVESPPAQPGLTEHLRAMAGSIAGAVQRARHAGAAAEAHREADSQRLRNALLASVAHDFRTPLASILGAVSSLSQQDERLTAQARAERLNLIEAEARHLAAVTDNTLQWVRLVADDPVLHMDWESIEEVVGAALARVRRRDPARRVHVDVAAQLPLVMADAVLLAQLLDNLIDNALKYSSGPVLIRARASAHRVRLEVLDRGPGFDEAELPRLFERFFRGARAHGVRGAGLGLAVGRAIARVHGGVLAASPRPGGGSRLRLSLPLTCTPGEEAQP